MTRALRNASLLLAAATTATAVTQTELDPGAGPAARFMHAGAQDTTNNRLLIHGGLGGSNLQRRLRRLQGAVDDIWAYDFAGNSWTELTPTGTKPPGRACHVAAVDTSSGKLLIHGGGDCTGITFLDDVWAYDFAGNSWTDLAPSGKKPEGRTDHVAAVDTSSGKLLIHGGHEGNGVLDDLWAYDLDNSSWADLTPSGTKPSVSSHVAALADGSRFLTFGGFINGPSDALWQFAWVTSTSTSTATITITSTTAAPAVANTTTTATVTATFSLAAQAQIGAAGAVCRPSAPALFYALLCVAGLAVM